MSYNRDKKEEQIVPNESLIVGETTVLDGTRDNVLVNGPAFSPGFQADLKSVDFNTLEWLESAQTTVGIADTWSLSVWWKPTTTGETAILSISEDPGQDNDIFLRYTGTAYEIRVDDFDLNPFLTLTWPAEAATVGVWIHLAVTWSGAAQDLLIFKNGLEVVPGSTSGTGTPNQTDSARKIKLTDDITGSPDGEGIMHSCAIWNAELGATEVLAVYNSGSGAAVDLATNFGNYVSSANLRHWYRLGFAGEPNIGKDYGFVVRDLTSAGSESIIDADIIDDFPQGVGGSGLVTVTLPDPSLHSGLEITVKDNSGNAGDGAVTIDSTDANTVEGLSSDLLSVASQSKSYVSDGVSNWVRIGSNALVNGSQILTLAEHSITGTIADTTTLANATAGGITLTLPVASTVGAGSVLNVKDRDGNATASPITIDGNASETIDGELTVQLTQNFDALTLVSDGSNWILV